MKTKTLAGLLLTVGLATLSAAPAPNPTPSLADNVRRALVTIPFLSVFDNLSYQIDNGVVTLSGEVTRPIVKEDAEKAVRRLAGVTTVNDQIEVLPLSAFDDDIRLRTLRSLSRTSSLYRYFMGTTPSIRIVVKNGRVTLDGIVSNSMDRQLAFTAANQVSGVFAVTNDLRTEH
jgi:hyperosmotically inducible periplasmic protein